MERSTVCVTVLFSLWFLCTTGTAAQSLSCGSTHRSVTSAHQILQSPGYPLAYTNNEECIWYLSATSSSMVVKIVVLDSELESSSTCQYDYVKVYDGSSTSSSLIQTWCGTTTPTLQSSGLYMTLKFHTDGSNTYKGFKLEYYTVAGSTCGGSLSVRSAAAILTSPGYPNSYPNNEVCIWYLTATSSSRTVKVVVINSRLESDSTCQYDYVKAYDGSSTSSPLLQTWCGTATPEIQSSGRYMTLKLRTDNSNTYQGFKLQYFTGNDSACGGSLTAGSANAILTSPEYPYHYQNNMNCIWTIHTSSNHINITVLQSNLESSSDCSYDYVEVFDGTSTSSRQLGTFCGSQKPVYYSTGHYLTIKFHTDGSNTFTGFRIQYTGVSSSSSQCGARNLDVGTLNDYLESPNYPTNYLNNMNCIWTIHTSSNHVKITVLQSNLESSSDCSYDYVEVFDGSGTSSQQLGKFCGSQKPVYYSTGHYLTIKFHTDTSNTYPGFRLQYSGVSSTSSQCGARNLDVGILNDYLESPRYPSNYPNNANCTWRLHTTDSIYAVSVVVLDMSLESSSSCSYDYLEAFDGYDEDSPSLGRWCGSDMSSKHSSGRYMFLKFKTDGSNTDTGFRLQYSEDMYTGSSSNTFSDNYSYTAVSSGAIIGGVIGAIAFVIVITVIIVVVLNSRKKSNAGTVRYQNTSVSGNVYTVGQGQQGMSVPPPMSVPSPMSVPPPTGYHQTTVYPQTTGFPQTASNQPIASYSGNQPPMGYLQTVGNPQATGYPPTTGYPTERSYPSTGCPSPPPYADVVQNRLESSAPPPSPEIDGGCTAGLHPQ